MQLEHCILSAVCSIHTNDRLNNLKRSGLVKTLRFSYTMRIYIDLVRKFADGQLSVVAPGVQQADGSLGQGNQDAYMKPSSRGPQS